MGEIRKRLNVLKEGLRKDLRRHYFYFEKMIKTSNPEEWWESDFQSYQIITFKCPVFIQQKLTQGIQRIRKVWPIQRKKINQQTVPEKDLMTDIPKTLKTTVLKILKKIKEDVDNVKKTMCK